MTGSRAESGRRADQSGPRGPARPGPGPGCQCGPVFSVTMLDDLTTAAPWPAAYPQGYAVVDVETTGLARDDRIISAAVYRLDAQGNVEDHWYTLVNPERDPGPVWIHGLTSDVLAGRPALPGRRRGVRGAARRAGPGRAQRDLRLADDRAGVRPRRAHRAGRQRLCTIALSKELALPLPNHKLESLAAHYGVVQQRAHHALDDARVLAEAFRPSLHAAAAGGVRLPAARMPPADRVDGRPGRPPASATRPRTGRLGHLAGLAQAPRLPLPQPRALRAGPAR